MKKGWQALIIVLVVFQILSVVYFVYLNNETRKGNKLLELDLDLVVRTKNYELIERVRTLESLAAGLSSSVKHLNTNNLKELFAKGTVFASSPCDSIRSKFKEVRDSTYVLGYTSWLDQEKNKFFTSNEFFIFPFQELKSKYSQNKERLLAIDRIEQCLLNEFLP